MLFSVAPIKTQKVSGLFFLLQKNWTTSSTYFSEDLHGSYLESFYRLQGDKEGTKPYLAKLNSPLLSDLESASEISLRKYPEKIRKHTYVFLFLKENSEKTFRVHFKLPKWIHIHLLSKKYDISLLSNPKNKEWQTYEETLPKNDNHEWTTAIVSPFKSLEKDSLNYIEAMRPQGLQHYRMAELLNRSQNPLLQTHFTHKLIP